MCGIFSKAMQRTRATLYNNIIIILILSPNFAAMATRVGRGRI